MAAQSQVTVKALGLNINPNFLDLQNGSLIVANDVIIKRDNVIESRRGLSDWSEGLGISSDRTKQLIEYKGRILAHYNNRLAFDTNTVDSANRDIFDLFSGNYESASNYRMRYIEANKNLYFTSSEGIKKISAASANDFSTASGYIKDAGAVKAIDFTATLNISQGQLSGFLPIDSGVAYRTLWGYKDANTNTILGAPSSRVLVYNYISDAIVLDLNKLLTILDIFGADAALSPGSTLITSTDFYSLYNLAINPIITTLRSNIISLANKLDTNLAFGNTTGSGVPLTINTFAMDASGRVTVKFSSGNPTSYISVNDFINVKGLAAPTTLAITGITPGSSTTVTTSSAHNLVAGNIITISGTNTYLDGIHPVVTTPTGTTFTIAVNTIINVSSISTTGNPTTITTAINHGLQVGDLVSISGTATTPTNITASNQTIITVPTPTTFTIAQNVTGTTGAYTISPVISSGSVNVGNALFTTFNGPQQVLVVTSNSLQFNYTPPTSSSSTITAISEVSANPGTTINSYNYTEIIMTGDSNFPTSLNDTSIISSSGQVTFGSAGQLATIQNTLSRIVNRLKIELNAVISTTLITNYLSTFAFTQAGNVDLKVSIPDSVTPDYFLQIYRSNVANAFNGSQNDTLVLGSTSGLVPDDELHLVYEYFPNSTDFTNGYVTYHDEYPDELAQTNTPLYTNSATGDGILQSNDIPPYAQDINFFKNVVFYANTKTRHIIPTFQLLGVENIVSGDVITIANANTSKTYTFIDGSYEKTTFTITAANAAALKSAIQNKYFTINSADDENQYYVWYRYDGVGTDPAVTGRVGIIVDLLTGQSVNDAALATAHTLNSYIFQFTSTASTNTFFVQNIEQGITSTATIGNISASNLAFTINTVGTGEDVVNGKVLISRLVSPAQSIDLTARSLIRVINHQNTSPIYAYYTSSDNTSPGQIDLESKTLTDVPFYVIASGPAFNSGTFGIGNSFNPDISPINVVTGSTIVNSVTTGYITFTTLTPHGLQNGNQVLITNTNCVSIADGVFNVANITATTFDVLHSVLTTPGTKFSWELTSDSVVSTNTVKPNRVYYSKFNQPEAVPLLNYFDIGPEDKAILRIFPLRNSLFVFKEDALYRISGDIAPFQVQPFDTSCILIAPDTIDIADNTIFGWTTKGITNITESGTNEISKPVDIQILKLASSTYPNFKTITWGVGYNSDYSYTVFTNSDPSDTSATLGFRYSTLTSTWTNVIRSQTCGLVRSTDDRLYMGSGIANLINQERKSFTRTDYADKDFTIQINNNAVSNAGRIVQFTSVDDIEEGDVIYQNQYLTVYDYNELLQKLDLDPTVGIDPIVSSTSGSTTVTITTNSNHFLSNGDTVVISGTDSVPSIDGTYVISAASGSTFNISVPQALTSAATTGMTKRSYYEIFKLGINVPLRNAILNLSLYLDTDPGLITSTYNDHIINHTPMSIVSNTNDNPTIITGSAPTKLVDGRVVTITGTQSPTSIPSILGTYIVSNTATILSPWGTHTQFTIPVNVTTSGGTGLVFDTDPNSNSFQDIMACYNALITLLNSDSGATFSNYSTITTSTPFEAVVDSVNQTAKKVTLNIPQQWVVGPVQVFKAIPCEVLYSPLTFGDPLKLKQVFESTTMFNNTAFTRATMSYSSDLKPEFIPITFKNLGNGVFGSYSPPGFGFGFFGGLGNSKPFRTTIPLQVQRCRFINIRFDHKVAREICELYGVTLTGNVDQSTRAYR